MAIIKCPLCNNDVSDKAKKCPHCNYELNMYNEVERLKNSVSVSSHSNRNIFNPVAKKINLVVMVIKVLGYLSAFIVLINWMSIEELGWGIVFFILLCIATWLSTLILEAIAEGLNLLQEIRDK